MLIQYLLLDGSKGNFIGVKVVAFPIYCLENGLYQRTYVGVMTYGSDCRPAGNLSRLSMSELDIVLDCLGNWCLMMLVIIPDSLGGKYYERELSF